MLAPHIKKKVDKLWDRFWSAGITNPLVAVEQITYLLFLKRLESIDRKRQEKGFQSVFAGHDDCKWSYLRQQKTNVTHLIEVVFPWLRQLDSQLSKSSTENTELQNFGNRMADAYFQLDPNKGQVLSDAIDLIDQLFARAGEGSAAQDVMGDTFEYLLSEIATAGKNGQFRTPRHLIRFMIELLDPQPGQHIIDPAAGTGGFLFSVQQYLLRKYTPEENLRLEWDGTPHRIDGARATEAQYAAIHNGALFVGLDNDRTMTRIGWMNLVLHGLDKPHIFQADSLSKRDGKPELAKLTSPESYDIVFANPPFTGTVDSNDIDGDTLRFPRGRKKDSKGYRLALTDKSELLFCWLMLDLLDVGGRCAVVVPEGVLFNNTEAHKLLRRELLTEHVVEAVISFPGGLFQPYTGVKTSVLIFRKQTRRDAKAEFKGQAPITPMVWFYEVTDDGYSLDAKRREQPIGRNDLWDALAKFPASSGQSGVEATHYYQPAKKRERWRLVQLRDTEDKLTPLGIAFPGNPEVAAWEGRVAAMHELFPELPPNPLDAETLIRGRSGKDLLDLVLRYFAPPTIEVLQKWQSAETRMLSQALDEWNKAIKRPLEHFNRACREAQQFFEPEDAPALPLWKSVVAECVKDGLATHEQTIKENLLATEPGESNPPIDDLSTAVNAIAREFAKLDGFDVTLRSVSVAPQGELLPPAKHWVVPVRAWAVNEEWLSPDGKLKGSHDAQGIVRPEYVQVMEAEGLYDEKGALKDGILDPDCIEVRDWNLSAGQYKPFDFNRLRSGMSVSEIIQTLRTAELKVIESLDQLKKMVEGRA